MSRTFRALLGERQRLEQLSSVYRHLVEYLGQFAPTTDEETSHEIPDIGTVPRDVLVEVTKTIETGFVDTLKQRIETLENMEIVDGKESGTTKGLEEKAGSGAEGGKEDRKAVSDRTRDSGGQSHTGRIHIRNNKQ